jgi:DNA mismatch repair protein MutS2
LKFFPESAPIQLEFDKIATLLANYCKTEFAKFKASNLRVHTKKDFIELELKQADEYKYILQSGQHFPNDFNQNISKELKLLGIPGAVLAAEQFMLIKKLTESTGSIFRWFNNDNREAYAALARVLDEAYFEKTIIEVIDEVFNETGHVKDNASQELYQIRMQLYRKRNELRRVFDRLASKLNKQGYLADIEESFMNGRRVLAVFAEQKRSIKGVMHGESDSRRTTFIEPEETTELNNDIFSLEHEESREVYKILRALTAQLSMYSTLLKTYFQINGLYDYIAAKAKLGIDMQACMPQIVDKAHCNLINAYHPLLYLYNKANNKPTIPLNLKLNDENRILVISGPNAGGKTVTMKTIGLTQLMAQAGLLVPVHVDSEIGIFKQLMIHIGDTQSIEFELSTYSSHLKNMKHFMESANGKTLFFIDELGSGSDPNLGGAFAEVIMEELAFKHSFGVVTTHYLNLKVMANKVKGIINGAMQFDEKLLLPKYKLLVGKPGSSYTFSIAERIGLDKRLINKAKKLVDDDHFNLDRLLNRTEQDLQTIDKEKAILKKLIDENNKLKNELHNTLNKERHAQETERLRLQNKISEDKHAYIRDMERRLKAMIVEWRKTDNKDAVIKTIHALLFNTKEKISTEKLQKKITDKFNLTGAEIQIGITAKMKNGRQIGVVKEIRGKKAILQIGALPITVNIDDLEAATIKQDTTN